MFSKLTESPDFAGYGLDWFLCVFTSVGDHINLAIEGYKVKWCQIFLYLDGISQNFKVPDN